VTTPQVIVVAGPNGAGKSTMAPSLLKDSLEIVEFVNADTIASGLSAFRPESVAIPAGRIMLARMRDLAAAGENFAFETTLASRGLAPWLRGLQQRGYRVHLMFLWLRTADLAVSRVMDRVRAGGHHVPEDEVRRRYQAGLRNLFKLYIPLADGWKVLDNSETGGPRVIATGRDSAHVVVSDANGWAVLKEASNG
jgi:predicted ABC-type ATPase